MNSRSHSHSRTLLSASRTDASPKQTLAACGLQLAAKRHTELLVDSAAPTSSQSVGRSSERGEATPTRWRRRLAHASLERFIELSLSGSAAKSSPEESANLSLSLSQQPNKTQVKACRLRWNERPQKHPPQELIKRCKSLADWPPQKPRKCRRRQSDGSELETN